MISKSSKTYLADISFTKGSPNCIIIFHGLASNPFEKREFANSLKDLNVDVFIPCIPYLSSNFEKGQKPIQPQLLYDWGREFIDKKKQEYEKVFVIGTSFGSAIVFDYVCSIGKDIDGAILMGSNSFFSLSIRIFAWLSLIIPIRSIKMSYEKYYQKKMYSEEYLDWKSANIKRASLSFLFPEVRRMTFKRKIAENCKSPILVAAGTKDKLTSKKSVQKILPLMKNAPVKRGIILEEIGHHLIPSEKQASIINEIKNFLSGLIQDNLDKTKYEQNLIVKY